MEFLEIFTSGSYFAHLLNERSLPLLAKLNLNKHLKNFMKIYEY